MKHYHSFSLLLALAIFAGCGANKSLPQDGHTELFDVTGYVKKEYPGVSSGEVRYFARYRVEFDLVTTEEVLFHSILVNGEKLPVDAVRAGNKIINTSTGQHLSESTKGVSISASKPVKQNTPDIDTHSGSVDKMVIHYSTKSGMFEKVIAEIHQEADVHRPGVGAPPKNR